MMKEKKESPGKVGEKYIKSLSLGLDPNSILIYQILYLNKQKQKLAAIY